ncbi:hypothetical protein FQA39_LY18261 [Lamprigera yunnana]|nr:hypothetical protein FQA39_LY18261 [Lamprigera yunnana]
MQDSAIMRKYRRNEEERSTGHDVSAAVKIAEDTKEGRGTRSQEERRKHHSTTGVKQIITETTSEVRNAIAADNQQQPTPSRETEERISSPSLTLEALTPQRTKQTPAGNDEHQEAKPAVPSLGIKRRAGNEVEGPEPHQMEHACAIHQPPNFINEVDHLIETRLAASRMRRGTASSNCLGRKIENEVCSVNIDRKNEIKLANERILCVKKKIPQLDDSMSDLNSEAQTTTETYINPVINLINDKPKFNNDKVNSRVHRRNKDNNECIGMLKERGDSMNKDEASKNSQSLMTQQD